MPKYLVTLYAPVKDVLRAFVTVEAEDEAAAKDAAIEIAAQEDRYEFYQCGDCDDPIDAEVNLSDDEDDEEQTDPENIYGVASIRQSVEEDRK